MKEVRHVERSERSPECGMVQIPEISHYVRDDGGRDDRGFVRDGVFQRDTSCRTW
ncbi:hypothetical protein BN59_01697 [Legionella massiliensis]|uniref:Uncharacterized protein n=1 Tax=Legionella massiliensis TaxID=1034943 RepID=A0A078L064_9GAMM|nr:hypothetical protein BN59_01697 [Legionella massiliensis]CEE13152.1 hypothetical protein BN1094_01697 [Legionella massiliensis]